MTTAYSPTITVTTTEFVAVLNRHLNDSGFSAYGKGLYNSSMRNHWMNRNDDLHSHTCIVQMLEQDAAPKVCPTGSSPEDEQEFRRQWKTIKGQTA